MAWKFECVYSAAPGPLGGLAWAGESMLFADVAASVIRVYDTVSGGVRTWREYTNRSNGIVFAPDGALYACQEGGRRVVRMLPDGSCVPTCSQLDGREHNYPRFVAVDLQGAAWFSDTFHTLPASGPQIFPMLEHQSILRLSAVAGAASAWQLKRMTFDTQSPRGLAFSPDGLRLYVADINAGAGCELRVYRLGSDGALHREAQVFHSPAMLEGLCVDASGRVLACVAADREPAAIAIFTPDLKMQERHEIPDPGPLHCAFGEPGVLYVTTASGRLYRAGNLRL